MHRRRFLQMVSASALGAAAVSPLLRALAAPRASSGSSRRFLFVFAVGGWDPLCVFAPKFGASGTIDMEPDAVPWSPGDFELVDHPQRPSVRRFFETWGPKTAVLSGLSVRSVAHEICTQLVMTSGSAGVESDWPALIAAGAPDLPIPDLVLSGPSYPGQHSALVSRVGSSYQLQWLIDDTMFQNVDSQPAPLSGARRAAIDRFVLDRAERAALAASGTPAEPLMSRLRDGFPRAGKLRDLGSTVRLDGGGAGGDEEEGMQLSAQLGPALAALSSGASRAVTIGVGGWDTHEDNAAQSPLFEALFSQLSTTLERLETTDGPDGMPLLDTTTVVVLSEMGRTPRLNGAAGRDHWPYTTAMLIGSGVRGGRSYGGYDDRFSGLGIDPESGDLDGSVAGIATGDLGATLLALAGVEVPDHVRGAAPLWGVLS